MKKHINPCVMCKDPMEDYFCNDCGIIGGADICEICETWSYVTDMTIYRNGDLRLICQPCEVRYETK